MTPCCRGNGAPVDLEVQVRPSNPARRDNKIADEESNGNPWPTSGGVKDSDTFVLAAALRQVHGDANDTPPPTTTTTPPRAFSARLYVDAVTTRGQLICETHPPANF